MATRIKREVIDFLAKDYKSTNPRVEILSSGFDHSKIKAQPKHEENFVQRWYLSLQGEESPVFSKTTFSQENSKEQQHIYRYDWAFGVTVIEPFWWDWMKELRDDGSSLAVHIVLEPFGDAPEAVPVTATLSALHPSRNTKSFWNITWRKMPKAAAEMAKSGAQGLPILNYVSSGLMLTSNVIDSYTELQKNWFIYQFLDEKLKCPAVEWRINKQVLREFGPLLRGSLFLAFLGSTGSRPGGVRVLLRPQIRYCNEGDICYVIPTNEIESKKQVYIEVTPVGEL